MVGIFFSRDIGSLVALFHNGGLNLIRASLPSYLPSWQRGWTAHIENPFNNEQAIFPTLLLFPGFLQVRIARRMCECEKWKVDGGRWSRRGKLGEAGCGGQVVFGSWGAASFEPIISIYSLCVLGHRNHDHQHWRRKDFRSVFLLEIRKWTFVNSVLAVVDGKVFLSGVLTRPYKYDRSRIKYVWDYHDCLMFLKTSLSKLEVLSSLLSS